MAVNLRFFNNNKPQFKNTASPEEIYKYSKNRANKMGKHKQIQCKLCDKLIRSNNLSKHYRFHEKIFKKSKN